ncbi:hypothetical protein GLOIN_2v1583765 [Rhizophagus irregularis DAOM 181602=DAOM 197198]|uniref:Uncharacterized protein n=1 Tax=Rhizophagus irregularis (strain DAOM 181602 / DAOM 197198 / MUCL 43194) TaxID=747089 RepID=A0A2P4Q7L6_RHIID|nr:hypothetical protein GLOIN_2v1583765 [Rhizophagus irregularis DAOM 181602=DAOM 197198]POG73630.1 hypothetical protein GLOIN_2v1583765 [Rhizophagus irregularis DAOM 181602=DAOM 197198]|eukprot:XP_025180496.1 hypothetical protein GLOIN_2v1583765 [Rhizophagus irregularis DAOM 181602=DAOM 197198]
MNLDHVKASLQLYYIIVLRLFFVFSPIFKILLYIKDHDVIIELYKCCDTMIEYLY